MLGDVDVAVQETLQQLGVEFDATSYESDASGATRIISCTGLRVISFIWSSVWTLNKSQQQIQDCMLTSLPCQYF